MNFKEFHVTGELRNGRRFKRMTFGSFEAARMINIYNGSVWGILENGRRKLIKRVYNQLMMCSNMIKDLLFSATSVKEFREKLLDIKDKRNKSSHYLFASLTAATLIKEIDIMISYRTINSIKFIVYPNNGGVDVFLGEDIEDLSNRFGWVWRELSNV